VAKLAQESGLEITVVHYPPETSRWNRIEHKTLKFISMNWSGRPVISYPQHPRAHLETRPPLTAAWRSYECELDNAVRTARLDPREHNGRALSQQPCCTASQLSAPEMSFSACRVEASDGPSAGIALMAPVVGHGAGRDNASGARRPRGHALRPCNVVYLRARGAAPPSPPSLSATMSRPSNSPDGARRRGIGLLRPSRLWGCSRRDEWAWSSTAFRAISGVLDRLTDRSRVVSGVRPDRRYGKLLTDGVTP
jgi:hypothetical protein